MADRRQKNINWYVADEKGNVYNTEYTQLAVLMDIRDELQVIRRLAECYRIPRALDAMIELGAETRRRKLAAAKRRKEARDRR